MSSSASASTSTAPAPRTPLDLARTHLSRTYKSSSTHPGIHAVSFQPLLTKPNQDRVATLRWTFNSQPWLLLLVCDGHAGSATSEYTARKLPGRIHTALTALSNTDPDALTSPRAHNNAERISTLLTREIESLDKHIGHALRKLCPDPTKLDDQAREKLIDEHRDVLLRAHHGTTVAGALVNLTERCMWAFGVGDSTVALATLDDDAGSSPRWERLNELHSPLNPREYFRLAMEHPGEDERGIMRDSDRVLGAISLTRAIGDFSMKLPTTYLSNLLTHLPTTAHPEHLANILQHSRTPPYLSATPSVRFTDLTSRPWSGKKTHILVFSDGVDALVEGAFTFRSERPSREDPVGVLTRLLFLSDSAESDSKAKDGKDVVEAALGHPVQPHWHTNRAVEVLGNLVGGTDVRRFARVLDQTLLADENAVPPFRVDDTSIVVCCIDEVAAAAAEGAA